MALVPLVLVNLRVVENKLVPMALINERLVIVEEGVLNSVVEANPTTLSLATDEVPPIPTRVEEVAFHIYDSSPRQPDSVPPEAAV